MGDFSQRGDSLCEFAYVPVCMYFKKKKKKNEEIEAQSDYPTCPRSYN